VPAVAGRAAPLADDFFAREVRKIKAVEVAGLTGPQRVRRFRTFAMNVSQIYDGDSDPVEMKIELEKGAAKLRRPEMRAQLALLIHPSCEFERRM
jgi:hypothetical protein